MKEPEEHLPSTGTAKPSGVHDPELAEEYAESVSIDPTPDEVNRYLQLVGDPKAAPTDDPTDEPVQDGTAER